MLLGIFLSLFMPVFGVKYLTELGEHSVTWVGWTESSRDLLVFVSPGLHNHAELFG